MKIRHLRTDVSLASESDTSAKIKPDNGEKSLVSKSEDKAGSQGVNCKNDRAPGNVKSEGVIGNGDGVPGESSNHSVFNEEMFTSDEQKDGVSGVMSNHSMFNDEMFTDKDKQNGGVSGELSNHPMFSEEMFTDNQTSDKQIGGVSGEIPNDPMFSEKVLTDNQAPNQQRASESELPVISKTDNGEQSGGDKGSGGVNSEINKGSGVVSGEIWHDPMLSEKVLTDDPAANQQRDTNEKAEHEAKPETDQDTYDFDTNSKEKPNLPYNYEELEIADEKQNQDDCPKVCPARTMMLCARCKDGVYRTFMSVCHMRKFACEHPDEKLELVSRKPCAMSSPYKKINSKGLLKEHLDVDPIQQFIRLKQRTPIRHKINREKIAEN